MRGTGGLPPSCLVPGCLQASWEESGWLDFLKEGLASFIRPGSRGGAGGGTKEGEDCGGDSTEAWPRGGLQAVGGGEERVSVEGQKGMRASGGGGGKRGD